MGVGWWWCGVGRYERPAGLLEAARSRRRGQRNARDLDTPHERVRFAGTRSACPLRFPSLRTFEAPSIRWIRSLSLSLSLVKEPFYRVLYVFLCEFLYVLGNSPMRPPVYSPIISLRISLGLLSSLYDSPFPLWSSLSLVLSSTSSSMISSRDLL